MYALRRVSVSFRRITRRIPHFSSASRLLVTTSSSHGHKDGVFGDNDRKFHSSLSLGLSLGLALLCLSTVAQLKENVDDFWENGFVRMNPITNSLTYCDGTNSASPLATSASTKIYKRAEIQKHNCKETGIWVTYQGGVYDITKFVVNHPGGQDKIMLAAGGDIEKFWNLYKQHLNNKYAMEILAEMYIGVLHPDDVEKEKHVDISQPQENDPFNKEPTLSPLLQYHMNKPTNAEAPAPLLAESWITPIDLWFVRNHHPTPKVDEKEYLITLSGLGLPHGHVDRAVTFSLNDLQTKFNKKTIVSSVQCGGNRRGEMNTIEHTHGTPWNVSAISTAKWGGVLLSDVLRSVGVDVYSAQRDGIQHVQFTGMEGMEASIPASKALSTYGDVLLAYEMNDQALPPQHGFPVRVIVPGHVGVRNVKWLQKIQLSSEESHGPWQRGMSYKGFSPATRSLEGIDVEKIPSLQEQPVQSAITFPGPNKCTLKRDPDNASSMKVEVVPHSFEAGSIQTLRGYAYSGGGRGIVRVDVSIDGGKHWQTATLTEGNQQPVNRAWAWTFWECDVDIPDSSENPLELICKATDASYNVQPDGLAGIWNLRGINNNSWHRVKVNVHPVEEEED